MVGSNVRVVYRYQVAQASTYIPQHAVLQVSSSPLFTQRAPSPTLQRLCVEQREFDGKAVRAKTHAATHAAETVTDLAVNIRATMVTRAGRR